MRSVPADTARRPQQSDVGTESTKLAGCGLATTGAVRMPAAGKVGCTVPSLTVAFMGEPAIRAVSLRGPGSVALRFAILAGTGGGGMPGNEFFGASEAAGKLVRKGEGGANGPGGGRTEPGAGTGGRAMGGAGGRRPLLDGKGFGATAGGGGRTGPAVGGRR